MASEGLLTLIRPLSFFSRFLPLRTLLRFLPFNFESSMPMVVPDASPLRPLTRFTSEPATARPTPSKASAIDVRAASPESSPTMLVPPPVPDTRYLRAVDCVTLSVRISRLFTLFSGVSGLGNSFSSITSFEESSALATLSGFSSLGRSTGGGGEVR